MSQRIDWRLDLVGKGSQIDRLTGLAASLRLSGRIVFHGFVEDEALEGSYERFLMPGMESLQRGLPVLHRESGVSDILLEIPWKTVMHGCEEATAGELRTAIKGVLECRHCDVPLPKIPTKDERAAELARIFRFV